MVELISAPLADANAAGLLHPRLAGGDILMACRMLASHIRLDSQTDFTQAFQRQLNLILQGLGSAPQRVCVARTINERL